MEQICQFCNRTYQGRNTSKFCGEKCKNRSYYKKERITNGNTYTPKENLPQISLKVRACGSCGKQFEYCENQKYCNQECYIKEKRKRDRILSKHPKRLLLKRIRKFGLNCEDYYAKLTKQGNACDLCKKPFDSNLADKIVIDHCHKTGILRGLIHNNCNLLIGVAEDDKQMLTNAIEYLDRHKAIAGPVKFQYGNEYLTIREISIKFGIEAKKIRKKLRTGHTIEAIINSINGNKNTEAN